MTTSGERINYFAQTDYRGRQIKFGIKEADRARHMYVIGKTGMGKSTMLENLAVQDIQNGEGVCFIDPHGSSADMLLAYVPEHRIKDVVYFAPHDREFPLALNVMEDIGADKRPLVASGLIGSFKKVWVDAWSPRMEYILSNALLALLEAPNSTLLGVNRMFADKAYRDHVLTFVKDPSVLAFWKDEFAKYSDKFATEATAAIQNKVGQFAANPLIRNIVGQEHSTFDIRKLMDEKKIFIVNLSKGRIGEGNAALIGAMLVTKIYLAAMSRAEVPASQLAKLPPFYLYVDEFQSFANESFADILSEARKYKLSLTVAHQYIEQMSDEVRAAVFGNVGTMVTFRVGSYDAEVLEKEFAPQFVAQDIVNLGFAQIYLKLMINNVGSQPFSATTLPRPQIPDRPFTKEVIDASRTQFAKPRAVVEEEIRAWHAPVPGSSSGDDGVPRTKKIAPGERDREQRPRPREGFAATTSSTQSRTTVPSFERPREERPKMDPGALRAQIAAVAPTAATQKSALTPASSSVVQKVSTDEIAPSAPVSVVSQKVPAAETIVTPVAPEVTPEKKAEVKVSTELYQPFKQIFKDALTDNKVVEVPKVEVIQQPLSVQPVVQKPALQQPPLVEPIGPQMGTQIDAERKKQLDERWKSAQVETKTAKQTPQPAKPFSAGLNSLQKKDKGPSQANLSGLKNALGSVLTNQSKPNDAPQISSVPNHAKQDLQKIMQNPVPVAPQQKAPILSQEKRIAPEGVQEKPVLINQPAQQQPRIPPVYVSPKVETAIEGARQSHTENKASAEDVQSKSPSPLRPVSGPVPSPVTPERNPYPKEAYVSHDVMPEIPEDVLRRVLELD